LYGDEHARQNQVPTLPRYSFFVDLCSGGISPKNLSFYARKIVSDYFPVVLPIFLIICFRQHWYVTQRPVKNIREFLLNE
jgi:hypothetical protein